MHGGVGRAPIHRNSTPLLNGSGLGNTSLNLRENNASRDSSFRGSSNFEIRI
jgi:hypothetical protein